MGTGGVVAGEGWREAWSLKKMEGGVVTEGWRKAWSQKDGGVATQEKDGGGVATGEGFQAVRAGISKVSR